MEDTSMNYTVNVVKVRQTFQYRQGDLADHLDVDRSISLVDVVEGTFVHVFHAHADVGIGYVCTVKGYDVFGMAVVHDLEFAQYLLADGWFRVDQDDLHERGRRRDQCKPSTSGKPSDEA